MVESLGFAGYAIIISVTVVGSIVGGLSGYGVGLLLLPVMVPLIGPVAVVPILGLSALFINMSRLVAFWGDFDHRRFFLVAGCATPFCAAGAYGYTFLSGPAVSILIGIILLGGVGFRRISRGRLGHLPVWGVVLASAGYGFLHGGSSGIGALLLTILLASGLAGRGVIATDSGIAIVLATVKSGVFFGAGALPPSHWLLAIVIGLVAIPGAFLAKRIAHHLTLKQHAYILDAVVVFAGVLLIVQGFR